MPTALLVFGGPSAEHPVSLQSAATVRDGLLDAGFEVRMLGVGTDGAMRIGAPDDAPADVVAAGAPVEDLADLRCDVAVPMIHGPYGEDGTLQGLLAALRIPFVGSGVAASAVCMDKLLFKAVVAAACPNVPLVPHVAADARDLAAAAARVEADLRFPVFVKPANMGSSIGIAKVDGPTWLAGALEGAATYDARIVVEEAVAAPREIEVAILGDGGPDTLVSAPGEILLPPGTWYDYDTKYLLDVAELRLDPPLDDRVRGRIRSMALEAFRATGCSGMARVDFLLDESTQTPYLNEINTIPGFTKISMYPRLMAHAGIPMPELMRRLCALARRAP